MASKTRLGELLVNAELISRADLEAALDEQRRSSRRLGSILVERGLLSGAELTQALSYQLSLPWVSLSKLDVDSALLGRIPRELAIRHHLIPVHLRQDQGRATLYVATDDPTNSDAIADCARAARMDVRVMVASPDDVSRALFVHHRAEPTIAPAPHVESLPPDSFVELPADSSIPPPPPGPVGAMRTALSRSSSPPAPAGAPSPPDPARDPARDARLARCLIVVGARPEFLHQCRTESRPANVTVVSAPLAELARAMLEGHPLALVVMEDVYAFDRAKFNQLALSAGVPLVIWSDDLAPEFLPAVLTTSGPRAQV